ncbi:hypothetical protein VE25_19700 [Devosia geojensis]|uniref:Glutaminase n=1 Tax=Devosia geojensis TaxID=443610 RepID=A0A0F5FFX1_9HYPH|nr:glutaminase family protein [Devosia geojensis]KKB07072.1 hypothetical protein VE25_19700 [Devosia geojensis]
MTYDISSARAPAVPLVLHDPFMSVWSHADLATDDWSRHWTGKLQEVCGLLTVDGTAYRFLGMQTSMTDPLPVMEQVERRITPLRTIYTFAAGGVELTLTFTSPLLPDDLELIGRPVSYIDLDVRSTDGAAHAVSAYLDFGARWATGDAETEISWGRHRAGPVEAMFLGAARQDYLRRSGDEVQIEWGYLFVSSQPGTPAASAFGDIRALRREFAATGAIPDRDDVREVRPLRMPASSESKALAICHHFGDIAGSASWRTLVAYDQVWAATYFDRRLRPYWSRNGQSAIGLIEAAWAERDAIMKRVEAFDADLVAQLQASGGPIYARLGTLALRQSLAAHILVEDFNGELLHFSKENSSNGSLATVDVTYPTAPFFLHFNPALLRAQLWPVLDYSASGRWPFPYAPHDIGRYPWGNGQNYGGGDRTGHNQMPVEECGNMLVLVAALAHRTGELDLAETFFTQLKGWADYLVGHGLDPDNQLCTDDFAGHMPHNANLAIKAIIGLGAFGQLCARIGRDADATHYMATARDWAGKWQEMARDEAGYRLAFDQPGSWSQKYNLVWDRILGLGLFPSEIAETEMASYRSRLNRYGLPLDSRKAYTKLDWLVWSACLTGRQADFDAMLAPLERWLDDAPARVPLSDWFETDTGLQPRNHGFFARSVVGGIFIKLLIDRMGSR